jgi:hypothetical protein
MEMSTEYFRESVTHLTRYGFVATEEVISYGDDERQPIQSVRVILARGAVERLALECVSRPVGDSLFYLEIETFHGLRAPSFQLDSWKHWPDRIEFKYRSDPSTAEGLAWILYLTKERT